MESEMMRNILCLPDSIGGHGADPVIRLAIGAIMDAATALVALWLCSFPVVLIGIAVIVAATLGG